VEAAAPVTSAQVVLPQAVAQLAALAGCVRRAGRPFTRCRFGSPVRMDEAVERVVFRLIRQPGPPASLGRSSVVVK
jgi:hypothetical protein